MLKSALKITVLVLSFFLSLNFKAFPQKVSEPKNTPPEWSRPYEPFRIAGNLYYVRYANGKEKFDYLNLISNIPSKPLQNYAFSNLGNLTFRNNAGSLGFSQLSFSNGAAYADLDNDGDEDLVVNNVNSKSFVYRNNANEVSGNHFLKVRFAGARKKSFWNWC